MATNGNVVNVSQLLISVFNGESYEFWSIKMKTLFKSQDLWDLVENGYTEPDEEARLRENKKNYSKMKGGEPVHDFLSRVAEIVNKMRSYGENINDQTIVAKILRRLTPKFDHVVAVIEESKDLKTFKFDELMGSLQSHEARLNRTEEQTEDKAFHVNGEAFSQKNEQKWRGQVGSRGREGRGRGRGQSDGHQSQTQ
ncbi:hypothetical protein F3Y22_tig00001644pilonHSYRG00147 [Hibiscus syriacus]|uniref:DUF4219 domain-containing protein n=1 Tax=Hibiscus syriacus TaxID=106335 RepID=A0A6A3D0J5_HIBSY|nr:hypothetical protein F3Y22_tig00001644pilonHSYRG00147 [Hibiscus syriacus]